MSLTDGQGQLLDNGQGRLPDAWIAVISLRVRDAAGVVRGHVLFRGPFTSQGDAYATGDLVVRAAKKKYDVVEKSWRAEPIRRGLDV